MKRRPVTLIEVIISLSLVSVLLTTLLFWYSHFAKKGHEDQRCRHQLRQEYFAYKRLEEVLESVTLDSKKGKTTFYSDGSSGLTFTFDYGIHSSPVLCNVVLGKLHILNGQLRLDFWPQPTDQNYSTTPNASVIFLDGVEAMNCEFLAPCRTKKLIVSPDQIGELVTKPGWHQEWLPEQKALPALVKLEITGEKTFTWIFDLNLPIFYPQVAL